MVKEILTMAGFAEHKTFRETRFLKPPNTTYAVYMDSVNRRGADNLNCISEHSITIELYEYAPDPETEKRIEAAFDAMACPYRKEDRYWINDEQIYQVIYSFEYTEKEEVKDYV